MITGLFIRDHAQEWLREIWDSDPKIAVSVSSIGTITLPV